MAREVTGYERGTITPFGSLRRWPVIADERMAGREITLGAGQHGLAAALDADDAVRVLDATVADISDPEPARSAAGLLAHANAAGAAPSGRGVRRPGRTRRPGAPGGRPAG